MESTDKILVYDDACPLCVAYTGAFVKTGLLTVEGRKSFSDATPELLHHINWQRSKNEIPLLDPQTKQVWYGIDALLEILGKRFPVIKTIGRYKPVNWLLKKLYSFISYNRKVIVAAKTTPAKIDCSPSFNVFYRILFMVAFLVTNTLLIFPVHHNLLSQIPAYSLSVKQLLLLHFILVGIHCTVAAFLPKHTALNYLGQINMLALITTLLLIPLLITDSYIKTGNFVNLIYLALLAVVIIREFFRRMDYANIFHRYRIIILINLICAIAFCTCLFTPLPNSIP
jgi:predicted DCC family thiol-disulfide oxidoreductase YuxK